MAGIGETVREVLGRDDPGDWAASGRGRALYADLGEPIVRQAAAWQDGDGRIIDPFAHEETPTTTARFVGALGFLLRAGRCGDLAEACRRSLDRTCEDLFHADRTHLVGAEFYPKELMAGYLALRETTDPARVRRWEACLGGYDPEAAYEMVLSKTAAEKIHNYATFALAGEACRTRCGLSRNDAFMDRYIENQKWRFTELGMYRDPDDPMTYDGVSRMNLSLMMHWGYDGKHRDFVDGMLRRGALSTLLCASTTGEHPYGGRSNQQNFCEAMTAVLCEYEAARYRDEGDLRLAGAFKRMAHLAALSVRRWLDLRPVRFMKNRFPVESEHGRQKGYGYYGVYSLLIASQFGFAHLLADDSIAERPAPCELGGYALRLQGAFHKAFAACRGYHVEVDTDADPHYDATGLGRVHRAGAPTELGLSTPIVAAPEYLVTGDLPPRPIAIGPGWRGADGTTHWLSGFRDGGDPAAMEVLEERADGVAFRLRYAGFPGGVAVTEEYRIDGDGVTVTDRIDGHRGEFLVQVPLLRTDGLGVSELRIDGKAFLVSYEGFLYRAECLSPADPVLSLEPFDAPNRNGVYKVGIFKSAGSRIAYRISLTRVR